MHLKMGENLKEGSSQTKLALVKLKGMVSLEVGCLTLFRYFTHEFKSGAGDDIKDQG